MTTVLDSELCKAVIKRARFCIFSKTAPNTLPEYDADKDFTYFFFNDNMALMSALNPHGLTDGKRNAKSDFPVDYKQYFEDDSTVVTNYMHPKVLDITEPWTPPGTHTILHTRKTAIRVGDKLFMLGLFFPCDDISLGITTFRARPLSAPLKDITHVPDAWYTAAFDCLPMPTVVYSNTDSKDDTPAVLMQNKLFTSDTSIHAKAVEVMRERLIWRQEEGAGTTAESWERLEREMNTRAFLWSPTGADWTAISFFPLPSSLPSLVSAALRL